MTPAPRTLEVSIKMSTIPNEFLCPITLSVMRYPVLAADGHTYEREAIEHWFSNSNLSPKTGLRLTSTNLIENIALRITIQEWMARHPAATTILTAKPYVSSPLAMKCQVYKKDGQQFLHMNVSATGEASRQPIVLILIVDNSGSMGEVADTEAKESFGYTRMDLVKHTIRMISAVLGENDSLAIITYSTNARLAIRPTQMTTEGRSKITRVLETIQPDSQTNIAAGVRMAMDLVNEESMDNRNIVGVLLTDGLPNINPPRGLLPTLQRTPMRNKWTLNTFGFGYNIDSALLSEMAEWGHGLFGFIPDCSMVATIFINFLANVLSTAATNATITYGATSFDTGPIMYGQSRDFVLPCDETPVCKLNDITVPVIETSDADFADGRQKYIAAIKKALLDAKSKHYIDAVDALKKAADTLSSLSNPQVKEFIRDICGSDPEGQIGMAPHAAYYVKWGEHYMRSYLRAQLIQQCMNFKDPGLQVYGGDLFREIQTLGDKAFDDLPPPIPSGQPPAAASYGGYPLTSPVTSMRSLTQSFNNPSGGCFHGDCRVLMNDFTSIPINKITPGSFVWTQSGPARVIALVTCTTKNKSQPMSQIDKLSITPWHPIRVNGVWQFPASLYFYTERMLQTVYNLVLDKVHVVSVEGFDCITLGHGFTEPVAAHDFFGTQRVIDDLKKLPGWAEGRPTFTNLVAVKDPITNMITEWRDVV